MKLLLDQNVSRKLLSVLEEFFPASAHVKDCDLDTALDSEIWDYAKEHGFTIVTQDGDFSDRSVLFGHPPKILWLRVGNVSTTVLSLVLHKEVNTIIAFDDDDTKGCLVIR